MIPRYTRPEMGQLWSSERRYRIWLDIELLACEAMVALGDVPAADLAALRKVFDHFTFSAADVARIEEIEKKVKHDVIAFLTFCEEKGGPPARHLHKGMTSSDVLDTALASGANTVDGLYFEVSNPDSVMDQAREQAMASAHKSAEQLAKLSGAQLGAVAQLAARPPATLAMHAMTIDALKTPALYFGTTTGQLWIGREGGEKYECLFDALPPIHNVKVAVV